MNLETPIASIARVGKATARRLGQLGIATVRDLLYWFPFRYEDYRRVVPIKNLRADEMCSVRARLEMIGAKRSWKKRKLITEALFADDSGSLRVVWFNQPFIAKILRPGDIVNLSGKVKTDMLGPQLVAPSYEKVGRGATKHTARLVPIYPLTAGITQKQFRYLVGEVMKSEICVKEWVPAEILEKYDLTPLPDALRGVHFPVDDDDLRKSTERLKFDELFIFQMQSALARRERSVATAPRLEFREQEIKNLVDNLPFTLTKTQKIAAWEILQDIEKPAPMNRMLSGDVGSGKTVVAAMAMFDAALNNAQSVLLAPTEILAKQHFNTIRVLLDKYGIKLGLFSRSQKMVTDKTADGKAVKKSELLTKIKKGELNVIIGTHALLSEKVEFNNLGLVVVDEQHRFGVEQRKIIKEKGVGAHFLSMTATPIPRSLALALYGDLDVSVISELPPGRLPVITRLVEPSQRSDAYRFIRAQVALGRQAFVVCPLINPREPAEDQLSGTGSENYPLFFSGADERKSVMSEYEKLSKKIFPDLRVGFLHGQLKAEEKDATMGQFKNGELDILVSTSVVEVGVDIPNASVMMVEGAERFGLAQLHQFRGRVGRSAHQSHCLLFTQNDSPRVLERLKYFEKTTDGFKLAEKDLEIRGPGEVYGTVQSGLMQLRLAKLTDREIIKKARAAAGETAGIMEKYPALAEKLADWQKTVHLE